MRGRQLGSNTGRSELWGTERHHMRPAQAGTKWTQHWHRDILRQFILILIYSRYTKHARRSNSNSVIDIRDWTLTDCVGINLNYSGSIFVFWWPSLVPWVAPAHWPVSICCWRLSRPRPPETRIEIFDAAVNSEQRPATGALTPDTKHCKYGEARERGNNWSTNLIQIRTSKGFGIQTQRKKSDDPSIPIERHKNVYPLGLERARNIECCEVDKSFWYNFFNFLNLLMFTPQIL